MSHYISLDLDFHSKTNSSNYLIILPFFSLSLSLSLLGGSEDVNFQFLFHKKAGNSAILKDAVNSSECNICLDM